MRVFVLCFFWFTSQSFAGSQPSLRRLYYESAENKDSAQKFVAIMEKVKLDADPLLVCFKGMSHLIYAKHAFSPYTKMSSFNKGRELLDKAALSSPDNIEIIFMRYCVQTNAPSFLGYNTEIQGDKAVILKNWTKLEDDDLKEKIKAFMLRSSHCTNSEKLVFK